MIWLSLKQVCELTRWTTARHVRRIAERDNWQTRISESRGRNGKPGREYSLTSLPADAQARFVQESRSRALVETSITKQSGTMPLFPPVQQSPRVALNPEQLKQAERKNAVLVAVEEWDKGLRLVATLVDGKRVATKTELLQWLESQHDISVSTIRNWLRAKTEGGLVALARKTRRDRGHSKLRPEVAAFIENKYLHEGLTKRLSWDALKREWPKLKKNGDAPSYATVRRHLAKVPDPIKVLAREGKRAYQGKCSPFVQRGPVPVMDWFVSDHRVFDVLVRNSLFAELPADKAYRVWMTAIFDWGSRKLVGFCFAPTPSSRTISSALRMAILNCGMPRNFYWDNGEDYKKVRRDIESITLSAEAAALLARDRVSVTSALPFHPRSKPIESWFARWSKRFDVLWRPAYVGNSPGNRPESADVAQKQHEEFLAGKRADSPLPTDAQFIAAAIQWVEEYNDTPLDSLSNRRPNDVMERQRPERSRVPMNPRVLDILLSERVERTVMQGGCVRVDNMMYEPTEESLLALDVRQGTKVTVVRDPYNLQEATAAVPETMQFIGELRVKEFVAQCPNGQITRDQIQAAMRKQRSLKKGYGEYLASLQALANRQGWKSEREELLERAGVLTGTDGRPSRGLPGSRRLQLPEARPHRLLQAEAFVSDSVAEHPDAFRDLKFED